MAKKKKKKKPLKITIYIYIYIRIGQSQLWHKNFEAVNSISYALASSTIFFLPKVIITEDKYIQFTHPFVFVTKLITSLKRLPT